MATAGSAHFELQKPLQEPTGDVKDTTSMFLYSLWWTPIDHTAGLHPRPPDSEGSRKERKGEKSKKKRQKQRWFRKFASLFSCFSRRKSTKALDERVEQGEVDQDTDAVPSRSTLILKMNNYYVLLDLICWKYFIGKKLGEGGCGSVFEGTRCEDGLQVAVKFTVKTENEPYISLPDHPRPVPLEVVLTVMANQGPSCPRIIKLLDWQDHPDQYIMFLERPSPCMGMHHFWLHYDAHFSEEMARHFMRQVTDAAAVCCFRRVFHRDIKMPNLLVNIETLEVKLIDFGCGDLLKNTSYNTYCVWSLGVLLFQMITSLFPDSSNISLMDADAWLQPECCRLIRGCLKSDPEQRFHLEEMLFHDWFKLF
uniref:non-specific serine/threonine protein kinase n=1 Tax=Sinocyclocheilus anshuiensis TaxID=1608454 RepID=A0A671P4V7_9TELE